MVAAITRTDITRVHDIIRPHIRHTPVLQANGRDVGLEAFPLTLKLEFMQCAGSFKARGAFTNLLTRTIPSSRERQAIKTCGSIAIGKTKPSL